ncbi:hypothetical protein FVE85_4783 [Porphyridium purpureum]|uniref:Uncharacterized protein n=1 Tax=Porphyridium purpureum TaxID=35688 RepID=A0A5J4YQV2_PORPP|nr:hypothetical protein FVE85_4783 [Porphyridium purpureum]|eukprot:POR3448..scf236_6
MTFSSSRFCDWRREGDVQTDGDSDSGKGAEESDEAGSTEKVGLATSRAPEMQRQTSRPTSPATAAGLDRQPSRTNHGVSGLNRQTSRNANASTGLDRQASRNSNASTSLNRQASHTSNASAGLNRQSSRSSNVSTGLHRHTSRNSNASGGLGREPSREAPGLLKLGAKGKVETEEAIVPEQLLRTPVTDFVAPHSWAREVLYVPHVSLLLEMRDGLFIMWMLEQRKRYLTEMDLRDLFVWLKDFTVFVRKCLENDRQFLFAFLAQCGVAAALPDALRADDLATQEAQINSMFSSIQAHASTIDAKRNPAEYALQAMKQDFWRLCELLCGHLKVKERSVPPVLSDATSLDQFTPAVMDKIIDRLFAEGDVVMGLYVRSLVSCDEPSFGFWRKRYIKMRDRSTLDKAVYWSQKNHIDIVSKVMKRLELVVQLPMSMPEKIDIEQAERRRRSAARRAFEVKLQESGTSKRASSEGGLLRKLSRLATGGSRTGSVKSSSRSLSQHRSAADSSSLARHKSAANPSRAPTVNEDDTIL